MTEKELIRLNNLKVFENELYTKNINLICGIDEAGRGPLAGPVVVGTCVMKKDSFIEGVNDSKKVSEKKRPLLYELIINEAVAWSVGIIDEKTIDEINILQATKLAVKNAIETLSIKPQHILIDALKDIDTSIPVTSIIKGDALSYSIACASLIAKVTRDRMMLEYDKKYPQYGFAKHKGYGTKMHIDAIKKLE